MRILSIAILLFAFAVNVACAQGASSPAATPANVTLGTGTPAPEPPAANQPQTTTPADSTAAPQDAGSTEAPSVSAAPAPPPPVPPKVKVDQGFVRVGWMNDNITGNQQEFQHYATPPEGLYIDMLRYAPFTAAGSLGVISLQSPFEADYRDYSQLAFTHGVTRIEGLVTHNRFFDSGNDPFPSDRAVQDLSIRQRIADGLTLSSRYSMIQQDETLDPANPLATLHQRTRYDDIALTGRVGGGFLGLIFSDWRYFDRTQLLGNTNVSRWAASYQYGLGAQTLTGEYNWLSVLSPGAPDGHVQIASLSDDLDLGGTTAGQVVLREDKINLPVVQNSYVREQESATASISHAWGGGWSGALGFQNRSAQRINNASTGTDTPRWQTEELRLDGDLGRGWRLLANGWASNLNHSPQMLTSDPNTLLWTNTQYASVRLNGVADAFQGYFGWSYNRNANSQRASVIQDSIYNVGGDWQAAPVVDIFTDFTDDIWSANDKQAGSPTLNQFAPDSRVLTVGFNWTASRTTYVSASYGGFWTSNSNPLQLADTSTTGRFLTLDLHQTLAHGQALGLTVAPWEYRDQQAAALDYNAAVVKLTFSTPFL